MNLFTPIKIGATELNNRIFMAPMTRLRALEPGDTPTESMRVYYKQRASAGLIITEATQISAQAKGYAGAPGLHTAAQISEWKTITDTIHAEGGHISVQLWHTGRISHTSVQPHGGDPVAPSAIIANTSTTLKDEQGQGIRVPCSMPQALTLEGIAQVIEDFAQAGRNAKKAGFDFAEIHAGHGYLLHQFLTPSTNIRTDQYGGSIENRSRLTLEVADAMIAAWGGQHIGIRISPMGPFNDVDNDESQETAALYLIDALNKRNLAYLHISEPDWAGGKPLSEQFRKQIRDRYQGTIIYAGNYDQAKAELLLASGLGDAVAFGRAYIANPDLVDRFKNNHPLSSAIAETIYYGGDKGLIDYPIYEKIGNE